ncbi:MAG: hypothetical protein K9M03_04335 [Kiritimatiellales bacterium]|nr:hypothetical protein [Kiritimatiellales bacterium]
MPLVIHEEAASMHQIEDEEPPNYDVEFFRLLTDEIKNRCRYLLELDINRFVSMSIEQGMNDSHCDDGLVNYICNLWKRRAWHMLPEEYQDEIIKYVENLRMLANTMH